MKHFTDTKTSKSSLRTTCILLFLMLLIGTRFQLMAQSKSRFPQKLVNQQLQTACKNGANTASCPSTKNELFGELLKQPIPKMNYPPIHCNLY